MRPTLRFVKARPVLPPQLGGLEPLAHNLLWDWTPEIRSLFRRIDPELWKETGFNPVALLGRVEQSRLDELAGDAGFLSHLGRASEILETYVTQPKWFQTEHVEHSDIRIAYFSAEFGLTPCLPIYSGGLGVLAGDHLKSASDMGLPLVAMGLLYQEGYFRQYLNADGWQMEMYPPNDFYNMPIRPEIRPDGQPVMVSVEFPGRDVHAQVWRVEVGRVPLFLLDTNVPQNNEQDRRITRALYGGGTELRIQQLMILGIGGFRALLSMNLEPTVCHMNEGHAGFLGVERSRHLMLRHNIGYELARDMAEDGNIFTTHTPVPAGFDVFGWDLVDRYLSAYASKVGMNTEEFMTLGRRKRGDRAEPLNMAILAVRHAVRRNAVSALHGVVSRKMAQERGAWEYWPEDEVPITHVTNGVHSLSVISPSMSRLFDRYLVPDWRERLYEPQTWAVDRIPDEELWRIHEDQRMELISYVRDRLAWQSARRGASQAEQLRSQGVLNPDALTFGFARRFATYKRATLLFSDPDRLLRLLHHAQRPCQFIFSGKAHPADQPAKEFIKVIASTLKDSRFGGSIVFLEDYDIDVARRMVQGVDVWLNNPQRPREASGTSGMKLTPNGGLNCSILDGWWAEAYDPEVGWAIGNGEDYTPDREDIEANALYDVLESQVVPCFYERDAHGLPLRWIGMVKAAMRKLGHQFTTDRMVQEYTEKLYLDAADHYRTRSLEVTQAQAVTAWKGRVRKEWPHVHIVAVNGSDVEGLVGQRVRVIAEVQLAGLAPPDVKVEIYHGRVDAKDSLSNAHTEPMALDEVHDGLHRYVGEMQLGESGRHGYTVRVIPEHPLVEVPHEMTLIRWA
ncbi:MAG: alpha-glucan family phosphorylase [Myxococcota bacterium]